MPKYRGTKPRSGVTRVTCGYTVRIRGGKGPARKVSAPTVKAARQVAAKLIRKLPVGDRGRMHASITQTCTRPAVVSRREQAICYTVYTRTGTRARIMCTSPRSGRNVLVRRKTRKRKS